MKRQVMISIDERVHDKAKEYNVSAICERALRAKINPSKKDVDESCIRLRCIHCHKIFNEGYICELTSKFTCEKCEKAVIKTNMGKVTKYRCLRENHEHIKVPRLVGDNKERINKMAHNLSKEQ